MWSSLTGGVYGAFVAVATLLLPASLFSAVVEGRGCAQ